MRPILRSFMGPEDVVQETWQRALEFHDRFDREHATYRGFLFGIAKNVLLEVSRRAERRNRFGQSLGKRESGINLDRIADDITNVSRRVARDERISRVLRLCGTLSPMERDLLLHLGLEGMSQMEVATMLAITRDALNKRWQRLKAQLLEAGLPGELLGD
jgi:RNA polymerase sigma-70 factor (ECF subfamily)